MKPCENQIIKQPEKAFTDTKMKQSKTDTNDRNHVVAVVIPTYKATRHLADVINGLPELIDHIIVVDDKCPERSGEIAVKLAEQDHRVTTIFHEHNQGVGGTVVTGYKKALELHCDIIIKMDSDDQMDPAYIPELIKPVAEGKAGYTKGNRFVDFAALRSMPTLRLMGNSVLSFMVKACSGYWNIMDPTNGYTAISADALKTIHLDKLAKRFFFESDMLIRLNIQNIPIRDVPIPARYGNEESNLSVSKTLFNFPLLLFKGLIKRFVLKYLIYDFNMASVYTLTGLPLLLWGIIFGLYHWIANAAQGIPTPTGTVMLAVLPLILGTQFIIAAINIDIESTPRCK
jgi:dolichol-phosphate mannosyltransferase